MISDFRTADKYPLPMDEPGVRREEAPGLVDADPEFRIMAISREHVLKRERFGKTGRPFHPFGCGRDRPGQPVDWRSAMPFVCSPGANRREILTTQACPANRQRHESLGEQPPILNRQPPECHENSHAGADP